VKRGHLGPVGRPTHSARPSDPRSGALDQNVKSPTRPVDVVGVGSNPSGGDEVDEAAVALRVKYRCAMCHKQCRIPCRFTGAEFRLLQQAVLDGLSDQAVEGLVGAMRRDEGY
jgi:hypothetical protein